MIIIYFVLYLDISIKLGEYVRKRNSQPNFKDLFESRKQWKTRNGLFIRRGQKTIPELSTVLSPGLFTGS